MQRWIRIWVVFVAIASVLALPLAARPVAAHEHVTVGQYELTVGWRNEPPTAGYLNGLDLGIQQHFPNGTTIWVLNVTSLNATMSIGSYRSPQHSVDPQENRPGWYTFDVIPTRPGMYSVHIFGSLGSTSVDVNVNLDAVAAASDISFPVSDPPNADLKTQLDAANAAIAGLQTFLWEALGVAILGVAVGAVAVFLNVRKSRTERKSP